MLAYKYDKDTKEYKGVQEAQPNPMKQGNYLLPANCTFVQPPQQEVLKTFIFDNGVWVVVDDYRGMYEVDSSMEPELIKEFGSLDEGYVAITAEQADTILTDPLYYIYDNGEIIKNPNYDVEKLKQAKENKYSENDKKASKARYGREFTITVQGQECVFDTTQTTQTDLLTAFAVCSSGATYDGWVTNNGVELDLTLENVALISQTFKAESNVYGKWNEYKQAIDNAETIEEVNNIDIDYNEVENVNIS